MADAYTTGTVLFSELAVVTRSHYVQVLGAAYMNMCVTGQAWYTSRASLFLCTGPRLWGLASLSPGVHMAHTLPQSQS